MSAARKAAPVARCLAALVSLVAALVGVLLPAGQPATGAAISASRSTAAASYIHDGVLHWSPPVQPSPHSASPDRGPEANTRRSAVGQAGRESGAVRLTSTPAYVYDDATYSYSAVGSPSREASRTLSLAAPSSGPTLAGSQPAVAFSAAYPGSGVAAETAAGVGARDAAIEATTEGQRFVRIGAGPRNLKWTFEHPGGTAPGTYAVPEDYFNSISHDPAYLKDVFDLPDTSLPQVYRVLEPPAGTPIQYGTVPGGEFGGVGGAPEVFFPKGY